MKKLFCAAMIFSVMSLHASPLPDYPFIFSFGEAREKLPPDICTVNFEIRVMDKDSTNALKLVESRSAEVIELIMSNGVQKDDVVGYELSKERIKGKESTNQFDFIGYEVERRMKFTLRELPKYETIMVGLLKAPDVVDIQSNFDRTDRTNIEARIIAKAVVDAKSKAKLLAEGSDQQIVKLRAISQSGFSSFSEAFGLGRSYGNSPPLLSMGDAPVQTELLFIPMTIEFNNYVYVIYEVKEKK